MQVILSSGKAGRFYNVASILQNTGHLYRFITTSYFKCLDNDKVLEKHLEKWLGRRVFNRYSPMLRPDLVQPIFYPEITRKVLDFFPGVPKGFATKVYNYLFDLASCKYIEKCDVFLGSVTHALFSAQKAKRKGSLAVLDMVNAHPNFYINILKEECKKLNIARKIRDEYYLKKMLKEFHVADYILVPSVFVFDTFIKQGVNASKLKIVPFGVDVKHFTVGKKQNDVFRIIFVGTLDIRKGAHYLLQAYKELKLKNSELLLVGKPSYHIQPILKQYRGYFRHIHMVPHNMINDQYSESSVCVLPSLLEGSANVIYEAMACGLPVIITENCGSIARDGEDGFVIPIRDVEALKEKILFLYKNETTRKEMGVSARRRVEEYSLNAYQRRLVRTLYEISESKNE